MADAYICDFVRTPIGRYGGALKDVRTDDLAAHPMRVLKERHPSVDWDQLDDVIYGCSSDSHRRRTCELGAWRDDHSH